MSKTKNLITFVFLGICLFSIQTFAQAKQLDESIRINRLVALCKLWGKVKIFHPSLAYRTDIDWDLALVKTIPKVNEAKTSAEFADELQRMLDVLGDSATRVNRDKKRENQSTNNNPKKLEFSFTEDKILIITVGNYFELFSPESQKILTELSKEIPKAKAVVFDLRSTEEVGDYGRFALGSSFSQIERLLSSTPFLTVGERSRVYRGFGSSSVFSSGQYKSGVYLQNGRLITPTKDAKDTPTVFLINENSGLLNSTIALQANGKSLIVFEGNFKGDPSIKSETLDLGEGLSAQVRLSEPILEDGSKGDLQPDLIVQQNADKALETALGAARNLKPSNNIRQKLPAVIAPPRDKSYFEMSYPTPEYRVLAAFRIWTIIEYFFPYKHLMERDWEDVLREFIPKLEKSKDALEYSLTVAEMITHIHDSHGFVNGTVLNDYFGISFPPIRVRMIENSLIVTALIDETIAKPSGIEVGDLILKVDGEDAKTRYTRYAKYIAVSTPQSKMDKASLMFMNGADKSMVTLTVRDKTNKIKEVKLPRKREDFNTLYHRERTGDIIKLLPGNIGYADLDRLTAEMIDEMFEKFKNTKGIIFDMRGYPNGVFAALPQRLTDKKNVPAALFETPLIGQLQTENSSEIFFQKVFPQTSGKSIYKGKTAMLIDERAMSQSEHTGLHLRAANGTKFIGSPTAGANGEVTTFSAPGGITIGFTGQSVKFPDGKQLQRIGLIPDIEVKPTIKGIRAGRDEVMEKAIQYLTMK